MGLYQVTSGDSYYVTADSREHAEVLYHIATGNMDTIEAKEMYPDFCVCDEHLNSVEFIEAQTLVDPVIDLS